MGGNILSQGFRTQSLAECKGRLGCLVPSPRSRRQPEGTPAGKPGLTCSWAKVCARPDCTARAGRIRTKSRGESWPGSPTGARLPSGCRGTVAGPVEARAVNTALATKRWLIFDPPPSPPKTSGRNWLHKRRRVFRHCAWPGRSPAICSGSPHPNLRPRDAGRL